jgi:hypothetical protein
VAHEVGPAHELPTIWLEAEPEAADNSLVDVGVNNNNNNNNSGSHNMEDDDDEDASVQPTSALLPANGGGANYVEVWYLNHLK